MLNYLSVGLGGVIGALLRFTVGQTISSWWNSSFPLGTLLINLIGAFVLVWFHEKVASIQKFSIPEWARLGFGTGLIGSFTTFSTFSVEMVTLLKQGLWSMSLIYVSLSLFGGLLMAYAGYIVANIGMKREEKEVEIT